jgi:hypothetical protein
LASNNIDPSLADLSKVLVLQIRAEFFREVSPEQLQQMQQQNAPQTDPQAQALIAQVQAQIQSDQARAQSEIAIQQQKAQADIATTEREGCGLHPARA